MEVLNMTEEDFNSSGKGGKKWDHEKIQEELQNGYQAGLEANDKEDGSTVYIGWTISDIAKEFYGGSLEDLEDLDYTNPNVTRAIMRNVSEAGFKEESTQEDRKSPVGSETKSNGEVIFKVGLTPE